MGGQRGRGKQKREGGGEEREREGIRVYIDVIHLETSEVFQ